jgi:hypothetical protein
MQLKQSRTQSMGYLKDLFRGFGKGLFLGSIFLLGATSTQVAGCGSGPKIIAYLSDPQANGMEFYNENTGEKGFVNYSETDKFVCMNKADAQTLYNYCGLGK